MKNLRSLLFLAACVIPGLTTPTTARADGCYACVSGTTAPCKENEYCRFTGPDTFAARKACEVKGCKVPPSKAVPCPAEASKICMAPVTQSTDKTVAQLPMCAAPRG